MASIHVDLEDFVSNLNYDDAEELITLCKDRMNFIRSVELNENEKLLVREGRKIEAIKQLHNRIDLALISCSKVIDFYAASIR